MITLYTAATPNGHKISIMLEEVGLPYEIKVINLKELEQKEEWFLRLTPNGRIPVIVDHANNNFPVFESGAILIYLAEKTGKLLPTDVKKRSQVLQWLMFQMGGIGPMMGQAYFFQYYAEEQIPYAITRYVKESQRLVSVMERQLQHHAYLAGDDYSIADIAAWPWINRYEKIGVPLEDFPQVKRWLDTIAIRPAVIKGMNNPPSAQ